MANGSIQFEHLEDDSGNQQLHHLSGIPAVRQVRLIARCFFEKDFPLLVVSLAMMNE
jgi:hypothetical protein